MKNASIFLLGALILIGGAIAAFGLNPAPAGERFGATNNANGQQTCTNSSVSVASSTATVILAQDGARSYAKITNDGTTPIYYAKGATSTVGTSTGATIPAGGSIEWGNDLHPYWGIISGIASSSPITAKVIYCKTANIY